MYSTGNYRIDTPSDTTVSQAGAILQLQNGETNVSTSGDVFRFAAASPGSKVGKAAISQRIKPIDDGEVIALETTFRYDVDINRSTVYIADFESSNSSIGSNPGLRVMIKNGGLIVERSKIGISERWIADMPARLAENTWYDLKIVVVQGDDRTGQVQLILNGETILDETGYTRFKSDLAANYGMTVSGGDIDRVQFGVTANSQTADAEIELTNTTITVASDQPRDPLYVNGIREIDVDPGLYAAYSSVNIPTYTPSGTVPGDQPDDDPIVPDEPIVPDDPIIPDDPVDPSGSTILVDVSGRGPYQIDNGALNGSDTLSIDLDFTAGSSGGRQTLVAMGEDLFSTAVPGFKVELAGDDIHFRFRSDDASTGFVIRDIDLNKSHVLELDILDDKLVFGLDGKTVGSRTFDLNLDSNTGDLQFGGWEDPDSGKILRAFSGSIDAAVVELA